jgi:hypothetical protein
MHKRAYESEQQARKRYCSTDLKIPNKPCQLALSLEISNKFTLLRSVPAVLQMYRKRTHIHDLANVCLTDQSPMLAFLA